MTASAKGLLRTAVHHNRIFRLSGVRERLFTAWFGGLFYNQVWEDPKVDAEALRLDAESRMLVIASAGCNVLHYLTHRPEAITAVDLNPHHLHLTRLKLAAATGLPDYESFFRFFGHGAHDEGVRLYREHVRPLLPEETRAYWDGGGRVRKKMLGERVKLFRRNFYNHARLGWFLRAAHAFGRINGRDLSSGLKCRTREEQQRFFEETVDPVLNHWALRTLSKFPAALFCLGIPPQQSAELRRDHEGTLLEIYRERLRRLACDHDASENYFFWQAFGRRYDCEERRAVPCYLKEEHFDALREDAGRVRTVFASLQGHLHTCPDNSLNRFVFLDAQDWMRPPEVVELWSEIARVGQSGSRIIFRTAGSQSPIESALPPELRARFEYEEEEAKRLHLKDRSSIYGGFHLYVLKGDS